MAKKKVVIIPEQLAHFEDPGQSVYHTARLNAPFITSVDAFHANVIIKLTNPNNPSQSNSINCTGTYDTTNNTFNIFYEFTWNGMTLSVVQNYKDGEDIYNQWYLSLYNQSMDDVIIEVYYEIEVKELIDSLKTDMDRIADTLDPNQTDPMKSVMDRIADAIEGGYTPTPTPSKIILVPEQEVTLEPFTDGLYIANIEASDELVQYQEKDIMCSINGTTGTLYWENGLGWVFPPDTTNPSEIQVCITGTAVPGQISFISSTSISPCVIEAYIDESVTPTSDFSTATMLLTITDLAISNFELAVPEMTTSDDLYVSTWSNASEDDIIVPLYKGEVYLYTNNPGEVPLTVTTAGNVSAMKYGSDFDYQFVITGDCEISITRAK